MSESTTEYVAMTSNYTDLTKGAQKVIENSIPLAKEFLFDGDFLQRNENNAVTFLDLGAADGGTALPLWRSLMEDLRMSSPAVPVTLISNDLPGADFNTFFKIYETGGEDSLREHFAPFYLLGNGTPFFYQVTGDETVDFSYSATAMHWLSQVPAQLEDHVHQVESEDGENLKAFRDLSLENWKRILEARKSELKPGGIFFGVNFCVSPSNTYLGKTTGKSMFSTFSEIWKTLVTPEEFKATNFPQFYRSKKDLESVAEEVGFEILEHKIVETKCPYKERFLNGEWDAATYAENFLPTMTTWSTSVFMNGLSSKRSEDEKKELVQTLWSEYQKRVEENPEDYQMDYVHSFLVLKKGKS